MKLPNSILLDSDGDPNGNILTKVTEREHGLQVRPEIVGLDFDPFLNSQDPETQYKVGQITHEAGKYSVSIYSVSSGKMNPKLAVIADVSSIRGHWCFVNFRYPNGRDLLGILKALRRTRNKPPGR